ncbi:unnamed protein product [Paramecium sonneborni]|uniref:Uncharacterized protein n=1 Tax=Paramecium sonneborni TaxID=65129 RepID=A0A8S1LCZ3_9CILI|nr:unnamed protein product [Paramecium sonneborni]
MNNQQSKIFGSQDKPQKYPHTEILTIPMHHMRIEMINNKNKMDSQQSSKKLEILRQSHQSSSSNLRLDNSVNRSSENLIKKTPTKTKVCTSIDKIPLASQNNLSLSPHNYIQIKPQVKQVDEQLSNLHFYPQKSNIIIDERREQLNLQQLLMFKEQENQKLQEINNKLGQENLKLFNQRENIFKDIEIIRQNYDQQNNEYMMLKQQNQQLIEDVKLIQNERNQTQSHCDQILNLKNYEIQQMQNELRDYKQLIQKKDQTIQNLTQQLETILTQQQQNYDKSSHYKKDKQNENMQQEFMSQKSQMQTEILNYQSQLEQISSEKIICDQKLIELQTLCNQFILNEKKENITSNNIQQKQYNKLNQIIQIQKKQIESQQKTIINQHNEIQNLQNLLYSNEQDSQYFNNSNEKFSIQQLDICDIRQKENNLREDMNIQDLSHISFQQLKGRNEEVKDKLKNMQKEVEFYNSVNDL